MTERHSGQFHAEPGVKGFERVEGIFKASPVAGEFGAGDEVIDMRQDMLEAGVDGIDINGYRNTVRAGDLSGAGHGRSIVAVYVKQARASDLVRCNRFRGDGQTIRPVPEDGAFTGSLIDDDVGRLVGAVMTLLNVLKINA